MMLFSRIISLLCAVFVTVMSGVARASVSPPTAPTSAHHPVVTQMLGMPLQFQANHGQMDSEVQFLARAKGYTLFLTSTEAVMVLQQEVRERHSRFPMNDHTVRLEPAPIKQAVVRMKLQGANATPAIEGMEKLPGIVNYVIGNDPEKWHTNIPTYAKVYYKEAYPGIDLAYYGNQGKLEYDFIVAPGADPNQIRLAFEGASDTRIADSGDLLLTTALGEVRLQKPVVYQLDADGHKSLVAGSYALSTSSSATSISTRGVRIQLAAYDRTKPLVIDPQLQATYLGGERSDPAYALAIHPTSGEVYVAGVTLFSEFPKTAGGGQPVSGGRSDVFVARLTPDLATLNQATYLGGSGDETAFALAIHPTSGDVYVAGETYSTDFPRMTGGPQPTYGGGSPFFAFDAFVARLNPTLTTLHQATYLGGSNGDYAYALTISPTSGEVYVAGKTGSANFPGTAGGAQPTFGGGSGGIFGINGNFDAFVARLNPTLTTLHQATYLGGSDGDFGHALTISPTSGEVYVAGHSYSTDFPGKTGGAQPTFGGGSSDAFVARLHPSLTTLTQTTYLGGTRDDIALALAISPASGHVYVAGQTYSTDFPGKTGGAQPTFGGGTSDAFVGRLNATLTTLNQTTYLGSTGDESATALAIHPTSSDIYVAGYTDSVNFPGTTGGVQPVHGSCCGLNDAFVGHLNPSLTTLNQATYLGGTSQDQASALAIHPASKHVYVAGETSSTNFPSTAGGAQPANGGDYDAFVAKIETKATDEAGPITSAVMSDSNPVSVSQSIIISATIDDSTTGSSNIAGAAYEVRNGATAAYGGNSAGCSVPLTGSMCPTTTNFDHVTEDVAASIPAGTLSPAVYDLCVQGTDANNNVGAFECMYLVVYDPAGSFVTGRGWIQSNPGFCTLTALCQNVEGKANFGFVSKYKKGATVPDGQTQFAFNAGELEFHSTGYEWLVVAKSLAQFKGSGTINGMGHYGFLLTAKDSAINGGPPQDTFRIKIWDKTNSDTVVYDNGANQPISQGNIVIH